MMNAPHPGGSSEFTRSGKGRACPVCGRTKDSDCAFNDELVLCHNNTGHKKGDQVNGYAFTGVSKDGRCGVFVPHKPLSKPQQRKDQVFQYSPTQITKRFYVNGKKVFCPQHKEDDEWVNGAGLEPWPLYRQAKVSGKRTVVEFEGEKCADIAAAGGLDAVSQPGHAWTDDAQRIERYRQLAATGTKRLVVVADNNSHGIKRANASAASATQAGLEARLLKADAVWTDIPAGGSIDDAPGSPQERAELLNEAAKQQEPWQEPLVSDDDGIDPYPGGEDQRQPLKYTELIELILKAIHEDDLDTEMALKAELMNRFRVPVGQVEAELLFRQMKLETASNQPKATPKSLDLDRVEGMDFMVDGFIPANDQTLLFGKAGTGKTTAAVGVATSVLFGEGFLDHPHPAPIGKVLFIASDSGPGPLKAVLQSAGIVDHPVFKEGPEKRFHLWASDSNQGMSAWIADLRGCLRLLEFVKEEGIDLVIIDSCKSVTAQSAISYADNKQVGSLLTYFKEAICAHTTVLWLSHDGTQGADTSSGAKAWKEVPSVVHRLEYDVDPQTKEVAKDYRRWVVQKKRLDRSREFYFEEDSGVLKLRDNQQVFPNCTAQLVNVLRDYFLHGQEEVSKGELVSSVETSAKTVENCLAKAVAAKHPEICRVRRGKYKLAPRIQESLKSVRVDREKVSKNSLSDCVSSSPRQTPIGGLGVSENPPRGNVGRSLEPSACNGLKGSSPHQGELSIEEIPINGCSLREIRCFGSGHDVEAD